MVEVSSDSPKGEGASAGHTFQIPGLDVVFAAALTHNASTSAALVLFRAVEQSLVTVSGKARGGSPPLTCRGDFDFTVLFRAPISAGCSARYVTAPDSGGSSRSALPWLRLLAVAGLQPLLNRCASRRVARAFARG